MNTQQIWNHLYSKRITATHPFDREYVWVDKCDFQEVGRYFFEEYNQLGKMENGKSYRSGACFRHIHAIEREDCVFFHFDHGNPKKCPLLVIVHFIIDVAPYFAFCFFKRVKFDYYITLPRDSE